MNIKHETDNSDLRLGVHQENTEQKKDMPVTNIKQILDLETSFHLSTI